MPNPPAPAPAGATAVRDAARTLRQFHGQFSNLLDLQKQQLVTVQEQTISFDIRLDATDKLDDGNAIAEQFGIAPQIATLEQMVYPEGREPARRGARRAAGRAEGFQLHPRRQPAAGAVHLRPQAGAAGQHQQHEYHRDRVQRRSQPDPGHRRVSLTVIEGKSVPYLYSKAMNEAMSVLNLANIADIANVVIPG